MVVHVSLWAEEDGAPVLLCQHPNKESVNLTVLSTFNNTLSFVRNHDHTLKTLNGERVNIFWRSVASGLHLMSICSDDDAAHNFEESLLKLCEVSLQMSCSEQDLSFENEKLRWYIKPSVARIQQLLQIADSPDSLFSHITTLPDIVIIKDHSTIQSHLDAFCQGIGAQYAAVSIFGQRAACSAQWLLLTPEEQVLLGLRGHHHRSSSCLRSDEPIYVPSLSRKIPFRFVFINLIYGIDLILLCGSHPPLMEISAEALRFWAPAVGSLREALQSVPRGLPPFVALPSELLGFVFLDRAPGHAFCLKSSLPVAKTSGKPAEGELEPSRRWSLLKQLLQRAEGLEAALAPEEGSFCTSEFRAHFLRKESRLLLVLLHRSVPPFATGAVAKDVLSILEPLISC